MNYVWIVLITVAIAALIGGMTNYLAIKMLFHPRKPIHIGRWKVWFTPGIIPKRKSEIARSLGRVVSDYLVTTEGLTSVLKKPQFKAQIEDKLRQWISRLAVNEATLKEWVLQYWTEEQFDAAVMKWRGWSQHWIERGVAHIWEHKEWGHRPVGQLLPEWDEARKEKIVEKGVEFITAAIKRELTTKQGEKMLRKLMSQFLDQAGGIFGALAGIFMDEDKMMLKVRGVIMDRLDSAVVQQALETFLNKQITQIENMSLSEILIQMGQENPQQRITEWIQGLMKWEQWMDQIGSKQVKAIVGPREEWLMARVPWVVAKGLQFAEGKLEQTVQAIQLPQLVQTQVEQFPIERLEDIILSVSGKEFRAITWLGAVLGGFIGLAQSLFYIFYN